MPSENKFIPKGRPIQLKTVYPKKPQPIKHSIGDHILLKDHKQEWRNEMRTNNPNFKAKKHRPK